MIAGNTLNLTPFDRPAYHCLDNGIKAGDVIGETVKEILARGWFDRSVTLEVL